MSKIKQTDEGMC